jgi:high-affinity Fe2+/Pb2+ permease
VEDLPPKPRREKLVADAESLAALVAAKAGAAAVADAAGELRRELIEAYGVRVAPQRTVDLVDAVPAVPWLGVFPTWQTLGAQAIVLAIVVAAFTAARRTKAGPV